MVDIQRPPFYLGLTRRCFFFPLLFFYLSRFHVSVFSILLRTYLPTYGIPGGQEEEEDGGEVFPKTHT